MKPQPHHYLVLQCVHEGYKAGKNDIGYWNFTNVTNCEGELPEGLLIVAKDQHEARETYIEGELQRRGVHG